VLTLALLGTVHCGHGEDPAPRSAALDAAQTIADAEQSVDNPGVKVGEVPSSLPGSTTWSYYMGKNISAIATNESGDVMAALVLGLDEHNAVRSVVCGVALAEVRGGCPAAFAAAATDLGGTPVAAAGAGQTQDLPLEPGSIRPQTDDGQYFDLGEAQDCPGAITPQQAISAKSCPERAADNFAAVAENPAFQSLIGPGNLEQTVDCHLSPPSRCFITFGMAGGYTQERCPGSTAIACCGNVASIINGQAGSPIRYPESLLINCHK
jgi:hypothetical protein